MLCDDPSPRRIGSYSAAASPWTSPTTPRAALSHEEARAFWYSLINYEQRTPTPDDLKLDRMRALLARLGNPQNRLRIVHIAGTKGKGSTAALLASVLRRAGYRTGLFTSPHLCRVEERFQVDGVPITADELTALLNDVHAGRGRAPRTRRSRSSRRRRPSAFCISCAAGWTRRWWRSAWAAASIPPTSAGRPWRSSPASASTTRSSWATAWRRSRWRRRASSSRAGRR